MAYTVPNHFYDSRISRYKRAEKLAALRQRIDELNLEQFIEAAQELALYPANSYADMIAKRWEQIACYVQIVADYAPSALAVTLNQFHATESIPVTSLMTEEKPESASIGPSLGWSEIIPEASLQLIAIPGM